MSVFRKIMMFEKHELNQVKWNYKPDKVIMYQAENPVHSGCRNNNDRYEKNIHASDINMY